MKLAFDARSTFADADDEVISCSFEGPRGLELGLMNEDAALVRMSWGDGSDGADEDTIRLARVELWPDRVLIRYEKDDQLRTIWLDGRKPNNNDWGIQGFSVGRYEGNALIVETDHFAFDITGFDDYNGIPSSTLKKVTERYWREGTDLKVTVTVEDPMFLKKPTGYTTRWVPARPGYKLSAWDCDPETSRAPVRMMPQKYK